MIDFKCDLTITFQGENMIDAKEKLKKIVENILEDVPNVKKINLSNYEDFFTKDDIWKN